MPEFDPYAYTISVRRMEIDGEQVFVGTVAELPHVEVVEPTAPLALESIADIVLSLYEAAKEEERPFPPPNPTSTQPTGRFTLRMPPWLHARLQQRAEAEGQSLNTHICNVLLAHQTAESVIDAARSSIQTVQATPAEWSVDYMVVTPQSAETYMAAADVKLSTAPVENAIVRFTTTRPVKKYR